MGNGRSNRERITEIIERAFIPSLESRCITWRWIKSGLLPSTSLIPSLSFFSSIATFHKLPSYNKSMEDPKDPLTFMDRNYSRPEQPAREFSEQDLFFLIQHLDNNIRVLEGKREIGERNYLDFHDSQDLNRNKFLRKIVEEWRNR